MSFRLSTSQDENFDEKARKDESELYREVSALLGDRVELERGKLWGDEEECIQVPIVDHSFDYIEGEGFSNVRPVNVYISRPEYESGKWDIKVVGLGSDYFGVGLGDNDLILAVVIAHSSALRRLDGYVSDAMLYVNPVLGMDIFTVLDGESVVRGGEIVSAMGKMFSRSIKSNSEKFRNSDRAIEPSVIEIEWSLTDGLWDAKVTYGSVTVKIDRVDGIKKVFDKRMRDRVWWKRWLGIGILECLEDEMTDADFMEAGAFSIAYNTYVEKYKGMTTAEFVKEFGGL